MSIRPGRPVMVSEYWRPKCLKHYSASFRREVGPGIFHQFGVDYEEFELGPGNYSIAIVEMPDGSVITPLAGDIQFLGMNQGTFPGRIKWVDKEYNDWIW